MKTMPDGGDNTNKINQVLDENAALKAKVGQLEEDNARLRKHMELQQREMEALQAGQGGTRKTGSREETIPLAKNGGATNALQELMARARNLGW